MRIDGPAGTTAFSYDAAGPRVAEERSDGTRRYRWDATGRLTDVEEPDGRRAEVDVDALGQLVSYGGTAFTWDASGPVPELLTVGDREVVTAAGHVVGTVTASGGADGPRPDPLGPDGPSPTATPIRGVRSPPADRRPRPPPASVLSASSISAG